eukprot:TRINITY_DN55532_c0_g1_i1.p2 TRINITY_DN55532_c0_g1~~TRINITY_DN55532_c0_g1_i1.p2  ORF type:complete len:263 (-),score=134.55 TRINITY_DN55532_c0_g1_i1:942-1673(-)
MSSSEAEQKAKYDEEQERLMAEECILVDENDKPIGHASKRVCHQMTEIEKGMLHRAFSVFLFNSENKLCLQQRAGAKITFPLRWTNTCCSHPLYRKEEMEEGDNDAGVKRAAIRKLDHELGIKTDAISMEELKFLGRIHYKAPCHGPWGEHEIDHILVVRKDVEMNLNENEVAAIRYVDQDELKQMFKDQAEGKILISPWFQIIAENFLFKWWDDLDTIANTKVPKVDPTIHKLTIKTLGKGN